MGWNVSKAPSISEINHPAPEKHSLKEKPTAVALFVPRSIEMCQPCCRTIRDAYPAALHKSNWWQNFPYVQLIFSQEFDGNRDRETVVHHVLDRPFVTKEVLIHPKAWHGSIGMRMEVYGCKIGECMEPLGMANGLIQDKQLKASSAWNNDGQHGAHRARLNMTARPQGWTANVEDKKPWLQVDLQKDIIITHIATQGFGGNGVEQWVESYKMTWENEQGQWCNYTVPHRQKNSAVNWKTKIFHGNKDRNSIARRTLWNPVKSKAVRFWPLTKHNFFSMRAELYGCQAETSSAKTKCEREGNSLRGESRLQSKKQCKWIISSPAKDGTVILKFDTFDLPKTESPCTKDFVEVRNGQTDQAPLIGKYCGPIKPRPVQSSGNALWVRFVTSGEVETEVRLSHSEGARRSYRGGHLQESGMNWTILALVCVGLRTK